MTSVFQDLSQLEVFRLNPSVMMRQFQIWYFVSWDSTIQRWSKSGPWRH